MDAPFYLAVGSVVVEPGDGSADYHVNAMSFPEPSPDGAGGHDPAVRTIRLRVDGSSASDISANIAALRQQCVRGKRLYFRPSASGSVLECRIREASLVEESYDPLRRSVAPASTFLTLTAKTDPYWLGPWGADVTPTVSTVPGHFDVTTVAGEVDALVRIRAIFADNGTAAMIAVKPDPGTGYDYLDDYGTDAATSDANAVGTYKLASSGTVDASLSDHWTAPTIDTNDNRGRHLVIARIDHNATTSSNVTVRATTTTTGNAIAESVTVNEQTRALSSADLIGYELGDVAIPAGAVPDLSAGSGYNPEAVQTENTVDDGTLTLTSSASGDWPLAIQQTFAGFTGLVTAIEYTIDVAPATTEIYSHSPVLTLQRNAQNVATVENIPDTTGTHKVALPSPVSVDASDSLQFRIAFSRAPSFTVGVAHSNGDYTSGALTMVEGAGAATGDDLTFKVYGQTPTAFNTSNTIQAACSESSKTVNLDYVQRIPVDYAALVYRRAASGALALFYDGDTDTPYIADADGIGPAIYDKCEIRAPLRVKPGVTNRVVLGALQADEVIGGATVTYSVRPRYLTATG